MESLKTIKDNFYGTWLLGGDFNEVLSAEDKCGDRPVHNNRKKDLWETINHCDSIDMVFKGS